MKALDPITTTFLRTSFRQTKNRATILTKTSLRPTNHDRHQQQQRRTFVPNPFTTNQTLTASRTLHYPSSVIYAIISDVANYSSFVPYCQASTVTQLSAPAAATGKQYPEEARLVIGFNGSISEEFTSRVYCVPERIVEAVSGNALSTLHGEDIAHHSARPPAERDPSRQDTVMAHLRTRWTLRPYPYKLSTVAAAHPERTLINHEATNPGQGQERTEVNLAIEFQFANPLYAALSSAAAPRVAEKMIEAFENQVKAVSEGSAHAQGQTRMEGVLKGTMR